VDASSTNSGGNTSVTANLNYNNDGLDTLSQGFIPDGTPANFTANTGTIINQAYTIEGQATTILNLNSTQSENVKVSASVDNQTANTTRVIATGIAVLNITSTAIDSSTGQPLDITDSIPLNESVTWLSIITIPVYNSNLDAPTDESEVILDGNIIDEKDIYNNNGLATDTLTVNLAYPGVSGFNITVTNPNNSTDVTNLNFPGNDIQRTSQLIYNGSPFDCLQSFAIATTDVTNNIVQYWLNQESNYPSSTTMGAAYNALLLSLLVEYTHDELADAIAPEYNVTWSRTSPIIVSVGEDSTGTYLTLDCDESMGMTVVGPMGNIRAFNYMTSSSISFIEYAIMNGAITGNNFDSVTMDLINDYLNNSSCLEWLEQNGFIIEKSGNDFIVIDPVTGVARDINITNNLCGAWNDILYERWLLSLPSLPSAQLSASDPNLGTLNYTKVEECVMAFFFASASGFGAAEGVDIMILGCATCDPIIFVIGLGEFALSTKSVAESFNYVLAIRNNPWFYS